MNLFSPSEPYSYVPGIPDKRHGVNEQTVEWTEHEHLSLEIQIEAKQLVSHAGSPELAKEAIDSVARDQG